MAERVGQQIGNYRILRLLGEGGFAEVYLGEHLHLGTEAAIKILQAQLANEDKEQFREEARTIARLEHPHIVRVLDYGLEGKTPYLVMSYAPNGTLRQRYNKGESVPLATIVSYVRQIADALQYAHNQRLIHRDVKPENMLIGRNNEILLSDFGIALVTQSSRQQVTKDVVGTVAYMAPEQIQGKPRIASDQYALGVVVYEWLTGERPFRGSFTEIAVQHAVAPPPPLREKLPTISPEVELVILTALAKDPERRFATIQAFANALVQASQSMTPYSSAYTEHMYLSSPRGHYVDEDNQVTLAATPPTMAVTPRLYSPQTANTDARPNEVHTTRRKLSRRLVLAAGLGVAAVAGGGITLLAMALQKQAAAPTAITPTSAHGTPTVGVTNTSTANPQSPTANPSPTSQTQTPIMLSTPISTFTGQAGIVYGITWASSDGQLLASGGADQTVRLWNRGSDQQVGGYTQGGEINDVKASHGQQFLASAGDDSKVAVYNVQTQQTYPYTGHGAAVDTVQWSYDGTRIVSTSADGTAQIWDSASAALQLRLTHPARVWAAAWSSDGNYVVTGCADGIARVWDTHTGTQMRQYTGHTDVVRSVSWSPNSTRVATASHDNTVQIWDALTGTYLRTHKHSNELRTVEWSHDGTRIVSGGKDNTAHVWNADTGVLLVVYTGHQNTIFDAQWSPDDTLIASGGTDRTVQIWSSR